MPFFDHYIVNNEPTRLGLELERRISRNDLRVLESLSQVDLKTFPILEIGPGRGSFASECIGREYEYLAVEANDVFADNLATKGVRVIRQHVPPPLPLQSDSVGVAYAANVMEHMVDFPSAIELLDELKRVVVEGGLVVLNTPDYLGWGEHFWNSDFTHNFVTTERRLVQMYIDCGLEVLKIVHVSGPFSGFTGWGLGVVARLFPEKLLGALLRPFTSNGKLYKLKLAFLPNILIVGSKPQQMTV